MKKILALCTLVLALGLSNNIAQAAPLAEPLFEYNGVRIYEFGTHYVEGFGEFTLTPTNEVSELFSRATINSSGNFTFNRGSDAAFTNVTSLTRSANVRTLQLSHTHAGSVQFGMLRNGITSSAFNVGQNTTWAQNVDGAIFNSTLAIGNTATLRGRITSSTGNAVALTVTWWLRP